jgi:hypothetical protein
MVVEDMVWTSQNRARGEVQWWHDTPAQPKSPVAQRKRYHSRTSRKQLGVEPETGLILCLGIVARGLRTMSQRTSVFRVSSTRKLRERGGEQSERYVTCHLWQGLSASHQLRRSRGLCGCTISVSFSTTIIDRCSLFCQHHMHSGGPL